MTTDESKKWTVLKSEYVLQEPWLTARRDHVRLPNGVEINDFWVVEYPEWVNVVAITTEGQLVMERQYRHSIQKLSTESCAGVVEKGETPLEAAKRELSEETGYEGGHWEELFVLANSGTMSNHTHVFLATGVEKGISHPERTEEIEVFLCSSEEVKAMLKSGEIEQAPMVAALWKLIAQGTI
ncbi:MAG: NUDIX hydrolase [Bacteroidales bacterium]|nr:NUDIX hydrolase [Bacteroidales bacterium]MBP5418542.1 NUDIX hydrolase [Bacteroidales bacterium]MCR5697112.1 NUDIX hydrolase [Marinilabiliaceae bacterium]